MICSEDTKCNIPNTWQCNVALILNAWATFRKLIIASRFHLDFQCAYNSFQLIFIMVNFFVKFAL